MKENLKKTLVIGASPNPYRYSNKAVSLLNKHGHSVIALGIREGTIDGIDIKKELIPINDLHTITLYVGAKRQPQYYKYILSLNPKRIIFNPGTENDELLDLIKNRNIEAVEHCTLVMLNSGEF